jgi:hypothetical protein
MPAISGSKHVGKGHTLALKLTVWQHCTTQCPYHSRSALQIGFIRFQSRSSAA